MRVGPASVKDAIEAVLAAGIGTRDDFYWTLHAVLVTRHEDHATFDEAFRLFWKSRELIEKMLAMFSPVAPDTAREAEAARGRKPRQPGDVRGPPRRTSRRARCPEIEIDARFTVSGNEMLRGKDFAQMSAAEIAEAKRAIAALRLPFDTVRTRRFRADPHGRPHRSARHDAPGRAHRRRADPAEIPLAARGASAAGGARRHFRLDEPVHAHLPAFPACADREAAARAHLRLRHAADQSDAPDAPPRSRRRRSPTARRRCKDWSGGTRIGDTLHEFNRLWSRRVLGQGAVVLLITDGLERDDVAGLSAEMERLQQILPAADLAQPAAALRRLRGAGARRPGDAAACRRVPRRAQSQRAGRSLRLARQVERAQCRSARCGWKAAPPES